MATGAKSPDDISIDCAVIILWILRLPLRPQNDSSFFEYSILNSYETVLDKKMFLGSA